MTDGPNDDDDIATATATVPAPPRWRGVRSLALVHQLNERCLELLSQVAASANTDCPLALVQLHRDLWRNLDATARRLAARLPFVMVDIRFTDLAWWRHAREPVSSGACDAKETASLPPSIGEPLMHETLMFVWHAAQSDARLACLAVGMSRDVSMAIAGMTAQEIRNVASKHSGEVGPRWRDAPEFWRKLLVAAQGGDENALADVHLHAKLLLSGELLAARK